MHIKRFRIFRKNLKENMLTEQNLGEPVRQFFAVKML